MTMKQGKVAKWLKQEGDAVDKGEPLFEVETEKITNTVQSIASGILFQVVIEVGQTVPVGAVLAIIAEEGERPERIEGVKVGEVEDVEAAPAGKAAAAPAAAATEKRYVAASPAAKRLAKELGVDISLVPGTGKEGRVTETDVKKYREEGPPALKVTPVAAEMARQSGIDLASVQGTGEGGKITKEDVELAIASPAAVPGAAPAPPRTVPFVGMRRAIAENMHASLRHSAQLTLMSEVDVTEMVHFRDLLREEYRQDESVRVSYNDIIIYTMARVLKRFPYMNSTLAGEEILLHDRVDIGMAVALPDGLIVPKVRSADRKGILQIGREARELAGKAREGTLAMDEVTDGTFTISNMSMLGVDGFTPILNPPETAILGVGRVVEKPGVKNGRIEIRSFMTLSLTVDHRVVDGAPAGEFLQSLGRHLEQPALLNAGVQYEEGDPCTM
jgi:pyruvate dehydrogenase E2 component (dihydrolipoamide acetyltransferase)